MLLEDLINQPVALKQAVCDQLHTFASLAAKGLISVHPSCLWGSRKRWVHTGGPRLIRQKRKRKWSSWLLRHAYSIVPFTFAEFLLFYNVNSCLSNYTKFNKGGDEKHNIYLVWPKAPSKSSLWLVTCNHYNGDVTQCSLEVGCMTFNDDKSYKTRLQFMQYHLPVMSCNVRQVKYPCCAN